MNEQHAQLEEMLQSERFEGVERPYGVQDVMRLRGSVLIEHTLATKERNGYGRYFTSGTTSMHSVR